MSNLIKKEPMNKLIDINMAIDAICNEWCGVNHKDCKHPFNPEADNGYWCDGCETVLSTLPNLPSAEPERKKGKWIDDKCSACGYKCSACGYRVEPWNNTPYCPNCGCRMGEEQDDDK